MIREIELPQDSSGRFHVRGLVNGNPCLMLPDTGARTLMIPASIAKDLVPGHWTAERREVLTHEGTGHGWAIRVETVEIAGIVVRDLEAVIALAPGVGDVVLLGVNFFLYGGVELHLVGGRMTLVKRD